MKDTPSIAAESASTRRKLWIIILLLLIGGPFAFVYCGRLGRAIGWQIAWWMYVLFMGSLLIYSHYTRFSLLLMVGSAITFYLAVMFKAYRTQHGVPWKPYQKWWAYVALFFVFTSASIAFSECIRAYWCEAFSVPTRSMSNTLLAGDRFVVEKLFFRLGIDRRISVVAFVGPENQRGENIIYVKRILALEGDVVKIDSDQLYLNGEPLQEPYATFQGEIPKEYYKQLQNFPETTVPSGHVFVLGDNRWNSLDSRSFGFIPLENLIGEAKAIFWSRELEFIAPTRKLPQGGEKWGKLRFDRIGMRVD